MNPKILLDLLRQQPFQPFRVTVSTGQTYLVGHPDQAYLDRATLYLGVPGPKGVDEPWQDTIWLALIHIVSAEPVDGRHKSRRRAN